MVILRQALQDEQSEQRRATDDPRPAYRQSLPEGDRVSSLPGAGNKVASRRVRSRTDWELAQDGSALGVAVTSRS
jgi:hypothetical protein